MLTRSVGRGSERAHLVGGEPAMCGIVGYMTLKGRAEAVGQTVLSMLTGLARRGPDSAGAAVFRSAPGRYDVCWVRLPDGLDPDVASELIRSRLAPVSAVHSVERRPGLLRLELARGAP